MVTIFQDDIFKLIFLNENILVLIKIFLKFVPKDPISKYSSTGSDNGFARARQEAIIWTNDG